MADKKPTQTLVRLRSSTGEWLAHTSLRSRLVGDAAREGTNLTAVATKILAERYKVPYDPNGRKTAPATDSEILKLDLPRPLMIAIKSAASRAGRQWIDEIRVTLHAHYGLRVPTPPARRRKSTLR